MICHDCGELRLCAECDVKIHYLCPTIERRREDGASLSSAVQSAGSSSGSSEADGASSFEPSNSSTVGAVAASTSIRSYASSAAPSLFVGDEGEKRKEASSSEGGGGGFSNFSFEERDIPETLPTRKRLNFYPIPNATESHEDEREVESLMSQDKPTFATVIGNALPNFRDGLSVSLP